MPTNTDIKGNRYSYHYAVLDSDGNKNFGIALLTDRVIHPSDLEPLKNILGEKLGVDVRVILSLSFLGREHE